MRIIRDGNFQRRNYEQRRLQCDIFKLKQKDTVWLQYPIDEEYIEELKSLRYHYKIFLTNVRNLSNERIVIVNYWFFQNKELKREFKNLKIHERLLNKNLDNLNMGRLLSYPPKAVELFSDKSYIKTNFNKIYINYCGIIFMSYNESIIDDLIWLNDNVKVSLNEGLFIEIDSYDEKFYEVRDVNENFVFNEFLDKLKEYINNKSLDDFLTMEKELTNG